MSLSVNDALDSTVLLNNRADSIHIEADSWITCYLGLGSNLANELGSPMVHVQQAIDGLIQHEGIHNVRVSSFYASAPMGPQDQPDFINAVVELETSLAPLALLDVCQALEQSAKRARVRHWGERSLDVDLLLYGQAQIAEPRLTVPHAGLGERNFVLIPLQELAPDIVIAGQPINRYAQASDWTGLNILADKYDNR